MPCSALGLPARLHFPTMERAAKPLAVAATIGMFVVLLMGATVTNTGSAEGCGNSWPLCHGEFIPEYAFETMVEYSHRLVTGVEGLLILGLSVTAFPLRRRYPELKALIPVMIFTLLLQSGMGAWAVKSPQTPPVMATHFGISLVCFASVFLVMRVLWESTPVSEAAARVVPAGYRTLAGATLLWTVVVAYIGAYMRHSGAELACYTWPLCNGSLIPDLASPGIAVAWGHRLVALIALALVAWLAIWSRGFRAARPDLYRTDLWALAFVLAQSQAGAFVVLSRLTLASTLLHAALMALLFAALVDGARRTLPQRRPAVAVPAAPSGMPAPAR
ncbi:MAG: COX15/CtaA family protein [Thermomicrobiales bacterium]